MYTDILKSIPFLSPLSEKELSDLGKIIEKRQFHKNQVLLWEKDTQNYMYIVYSGKAKVVHMSIDGKEQILAIHRAGDFFGEMALLDGKTAPATVIALEESEIGLITKESFDRYIMKNDRVMKEISSLLCSRLREAWLRLKVLSFADAEHRVRDALDRELERRGHRFVRYADDCNIYVRSERAGQRVMESITRLHHAKAQAQGE